MGPTHCDSIGALPCSPNLGGTGAGRGGGLGHGHSLGRVVLGELKGSRGEESGERRYLGADHGGEHGDGNGLEGEVELHLELVVEGWLVRSWLCLYFVFCCENVTFG
jgi:hypothetical protein